jgi:hypothetical protein
MHADNRQNLEYVAKRLVNNAKVHRSLLQGRRRFWSRGKSGLYEHTTSLPVNVAAIEKLFDYIARALVWLHWGVYITQEYIVESTTLLDSESVLFDIYFAGASDDLKVSVNLGDGTFLYVGFRDTSSLVTTAWRFSIYNGLTLGNSRTAREVASHFHAFTGVRVPVDERANL